MLVMGDGIERVQRDANADVVQTVRAPLPRRQRVGWAHHYGAGALLAMCGGQLGLFCAGSMVGGLSGAVLGGLVGGLSMRWLGTRQRVPAPAAVPYEVSMRALEEAQRTQLEVLARLREISQATQDVAPASSRP